MLLSFCLIFWQFQPGFAYKSVAYKKKACKKRHQKDGNWRRCISLMLTFNKFHTFFWCFHEFELVNGDWVICFFRLSTYFLTTSRCLQIFFKISVVLQLYLKKTPTQVLFYEYCKIFKNTLFCRTLVWPLLNYWNINPGSASDEWVLPSYRNQWNLYEGNTGT